LLPVFDARARIALIHVEDAARQIAAAAARPPKQGCFALSDARPEGYGWREIVQTAAAAVGRRGRLVPMPGAVLAGAGAAGSLAQALGGRPMLTLGKSRELRWPDWSLKPEERWANAPPAGYLLAEGFGHTIEWWRATQGLVV
jgi:nucleoside-diphosphate-sugar epimerase